MKIRFIKSSYEIDMLGQTGIEKLKHIEKVARLCYKTEDRITDTSYEALIRHLIKNGHTAMLEFASFAVKFIASRAFTHELVRHRIASFAQESQRYVGYGDCIEFIIPSWCNIEPFEVEVPDDGRSKKLLEDLHHIVALKNGVYDSTPDELCPDYIWAYSCVTSAQHYCSLLKNGWRPEQARDVLPNAAKTEIWINTNFRSWMNVEELRDANTASPQMRELMNPLFNDLRKMIPGVF